MQSEGRSEEVLPLTTTINQEQVMLEGIQQALPICGRNCKI